MKKIVLSVLFFLISGCSMPSTVVQTVDTRPSIAIKGASTGAELIIDGLNMGSANDYNGSPQTLVIEPGTHKVIIIDNGAVMLEQTIFVESELKIISVR